MRSCNDLGSIPLVDISTFGNWHGTKNLHSTPESRPDRDWFHPSLIFDKIFKNKNPKFWMLTMFAFRWGEASQACDLPGLWKGSRCGLAGGGWGRLAREEGWWGRKGTVRGLKARPGFCSLGLWLTRGDTQAGGGRGGSRQGRTHPPVVWSVGLTNRKKCNLQEKRIG